MVVRAHPGMSKAWSIGFVATIGATLLVYFSLPVGTKSAVFDAVGVAAAGAMFVGVVRNRRNRASLDAARVRDVADGGRRHRFGTTQPVPSVADMLYVSAYVALTLGFVGLIRSEFPASPGSPQRLDAVIVAAGRGDRGHPVVDRAGRPSRMGSASPARAVSLGYPIDRPDPASPSCSSRRIEARRAANDLLPVGRRPAAQAGRRRRLRPVALRHDIRDGDPADAFWLLSYALFGAALLHPAVGAGEDGRVIDLDTSSRLRC